MHQGKKRIGEFGPHRLINEMRGRINALLKKNQSLAMEEIDTEDERGPVGIIPEGKANLRSIKSPEELVGKSKTDRPRESEI